MIMSDSFHRSALARDNELHVFTNNPLSIIDGDDGDFPPKLHPQQQPPTVVQFAAAEARDFARSVAMVSEEAAQGVDLNCGCPQTWAIQEGIGSYWMNSKHWDRLEAMLRDARRVARVPLSVKIRVMERADETVELVRRLERCGIAWLAVHGRTRKQKSTEPVNVEAIARVKQNLSIPVIANGSVFSLEDAWRVHAETGADGIMAARGILTNPLLFSSPEKKQRMTLEKVCEFIEICVALGMHTCLLHHHLSQLLEPLLSPNTLRHFNSLGPGSLPAILDFVAIHVLS